MSVNYYCSGFNTKKAFFPELERRLKDDLSATKRIVYIPGSNTPEKIAKAFNKYIPTFTEHFKNIGIVFENVECITPDMDPDLAQNLVMNSNMVMMMGGNPFLQKELYESKGLTNILKKYNGVIMGFSAGAMNMSKYIIITPCSEEYPDFDVRPALNLDELSIYPHNNFEGDIFPEYIDMGGEVTRTSDLLKVAQEYGNFYCLQDHELESGNTNVSLIRCCGNDIQIIIENNGKVFEVSKDSVAIVDKIKEEKIKR